MQDDLESGRLSRHVHSPRTSRQYCTFVSVVWNGTLCEATTKTTARSATQEVNLCQRNNSNLLIGGVGVWNCCWWSSCNDAFIAAITTNMQCIGIAMLRVWCHAALASNSENGEANGWWLGTANRKYYANDVNGARSCCCTFPMINASIRTIRMSLIYQFVDGDVFSNRTIRHRNPCHLQPALSSSIIVNQWWIRSWMVFRIRRAFFAWLLLRLDNCDIYREYTNRLAIPIT